MRIVNKLKCLVGLHIWIFNLDYTYKQNKYADYFKCSNCGKLKISEIKTRG